MVRSVLIHITSPLAPPPAAAEKLVFLWDSPTPGPFSDSSDAVLNEAGRTRSLAAVPAAPHPPPPLSRFPRALDVAPRHASPAPPRGSPPRRARPSLRSVSASRAPPPPAPSPPRASRGSAGFAARRHPIRDVPRRPPACDPPARCPSRRRRWVGPPREAHQCPPNTAVVFDPTETLISQRWDARRAANASIARPEAAGDYAQWEVDAWIADAPPSPPRAGEATATIPPPPPPPPPRSTASPRWTPRLADGPRGDGVRVVAHDRRRRRPPRQAPRPRRRPPRSPTHSTPAPGAPPINPPARTARARSTRPGTGGSGS